MANNGSQTAKFPAIFISHGMPLMALAESPTHFFLKELGKKTGDAPKPSSAFPPTGRP